MERIMPILLFIATVAISISEHQKKAKKEAAGSDVDFEPLEFDDEGQVEVKQPAAAATHKAQPAVRQADARPAAVSMPEDEKQNAQEKIDKRKLIIYSEILKPKFDR